MFRSVQRRAVKGLCKATRQPLDPIKHLKSVSCVNQLSLLKIHMRLFFLKKKKKTLTILSAECDNNAEISDCLHYSQSN